MARKSASSAKIKALEPQKKMRPIEEVFDEAKAMFKLTVDTNEKTAHRIDNLLNVRDYAIKFWGSSDKAPKLDIPYFKMLAEVGIDTYKEISKRVDLFDLEDFKKEEVTNYFEDLVPTFDEVKTQEELAIAGIKFLSVQPYGQKLVQLHRLMLDEIAQREA